MADQSLKGNFEEEKIDPSSVYKAGCTVRMSVQRGHFWWTSERPEKKEVGEA